MSEPKTRRRGAVLEQAILDAAWLEMSDHGWGGFTVEGVAARSGTAKTVIYRRWDNRGQLAQEMLRRSAAAGDHAFASTGDLRTDLVAFLENMAEFLRGPFGEAARGVVSEGEPAARTSMFADVTVIGILQEVIETAVRDGQLPRTPSAAVVNLGHAVVMWEFLQTHEPPSPQDIAVLVDRMWLPALRHDG